MDVPAAVEGLVVAIGVDGQFAEERAVLADDSNVWAGHEEADHAVSVGGADADVAQAAEVRPDRDRRPDQP